MFCHQNGKRIIPQTEHQRLAAALAGSWGGEGFAVPQVGLENLAASTYAHDRCYGELDRWEVGNTPRDTWLALRRRGLLMDDDNPVVNALFCMHNMCLLKDAFDPPSVRLYNDSRAKLGEIQAKIPFPLKELEAAFSLQRLCDEISYRCCRGEHACGSMVIWRNPASPRWIELEFEVLPNLNVTVKPWPFKPVELRGTITSYRRLGYFASPRRLEKEIFSVRVTPPKSDSAPTQARCEESSRNPLNLI